MQIINGRNGAISFPAFWNHRGLVQTCLGLVHDTTLHDLLLIYEKTLSIGVEKKGKQQLKWWSLPWCTKADWIKKIKQKATAKRLLDGDVISTNWKRFNLLFSPAEEEDQQVLSDLINKK